MVKSRLLQSSSIAAACLMMAAFASESRAQAAPADQQTPSIGSGAAGAASPTPDDQDTSHDVVVTGAYAESLKRARDKKRDSPLVIEALSISDLAQLPDVSVADALSRLPGLAADRDPNNGAKSQISIRGMGPQLSLGTLNGRDLATATPDRNIRYDQFPSELIGGAVVYKSPMASINEGGVAGSIDLATVKPLDYRATKVTADLRGVYNQIGDEFAANKRFGYRGSVSYIGQFLDHTLGIAIGYARRREPYNVLRTQHAGYDPGGYVDYNGDGRSDDATYTLAQFTRTGEDERQGGIAVVEWKPSSAIHLTIDGLYSKVKLDGDIAGVYAANVNQEFANTYTNTVVNGNHLVAATVTGLPPAQTFGDDLMLQDFAAISRRNDRLTSIGGNLHFTPGGPWEATLDAAYSGVRYTADYYELRTDAVRAQNGVLALIPNQTVTYDARGEVPTFGGVNFSLTDPTINRPATLTLPFFENGKDDIYSFKVDTVYTSGRDWLPHIRIGMRYVDRTKSNLNLVDSVSLPVAGLPVLTAAQLGSNPLGSYGGPQVGAAPQYLNFNLVQVADQYFGGLNPYSTPASQAASWRVRERTMGGYVQADFAAGTRVTGNIGVRLIQTDDASSSVRQSSGNAGTGPLLPYLVTNSYFDWLPSLNMTFHASDKLQFRLGLAKTIARPAIDDLNAGFQAFNYGVAQAYGGNPLLQPFRANQLDVTAEYYFGKSDYVSLTGFYKDLRSYITTGQQTVLVDGAPYQFFQPVNGQGGYIRGFEATFQKQFSELPAPFDGLGVYANYAFVDSDVKVTRNFSDSTLGLVGLSKHTATGTIFYYKSGFEARASYNFRSSYANVVDGGSFETNDNAGYLDAQVSYEFRKGFSVILQGQNLTDTPNRTYLGNVSAERGRYEQFGRIFYAGVRVAL